jgi:hypothetical protein
MIGAVDRDDLIVDLLELTDDRREGIPHKPGWTFRPERLL